MTHNWHNCRVLPVVKTAHGFWRGPDSRGDYHYFHKGRYTGSVIDKNVEWAVFKTLVFDCLGTYTSLTEAKEVLEGQ